ncbi:MAG: hypothetical protein HY535_06445 [Chloroflexi bacterium]|nr:hypothetical protein [Chloroflexota bacterium]
MQALFVRARERIKKSVDRERPLERYALAVSRYLWPWPERWLLLIVVFPVALLDYSSTYLALGPGGNPLAYESGPLASWALGKGGFGALALMDVAELLFLAGLAGGARFAYRKAGFPGFARAAFVLTLLPYCVRALWATWTNVALALS